MLNGINDYVRIFRDRCKRQVVGLCSTCCKHHVSWTSTNGMRQDSAGTFYLVTNLARQSIRSRWVIELLREVRNHYINYTWIHRCSCGKVQVHVACWMFWFCRRHVHYKSFGFLAVLRTRVRRAACLRRPATGVRNDLAELGSYDLSAESGDVNVIFWKRADTKLSS